MTGPRRRVRVDGERQIMARTAGPPRLSRWQVLAGGATPTATATPPHDASDVY